VGAQNIPHALLLELVVLVPDILIIILLDLLLICPEGPLSILSALFNLIFLDHHGERLPL
jgi:hypothetical protein